MRDEAGYDMDDPGLMIEQIYQDYLEQGEFNATAVGHVQGGFVVFYPEKDPGHKIIVPTVDLFRVADTCREMLNEVAVDQLIMDATRPKAAPCPTPLEDLNEDLGTDQTKRQGDEDTTNGETNEPE